MKALCRDLGLGDVFWQTKFLELVRSCGWYPAAPVIMFNFLVESSRRRMIPPCPFVVVCFVPWAEGLCEHRGVRIRVKERPADCFLPQVPVFFEGFVGVDPCALDFVWVLLFVPHCGIDVGASDIGYVC